MELDDEHPNAESEESQAAFFQLAGSGKLGRSITNSTTELDALMPGVAKFRTISTNPSTDLIL